ncbi:hypothetical protein BFW01_g9128 [Lasiodiplodia theobromae]|uniref:12 kDa heat shock protein n=2 Tax=Lasiodiplodia TaxID=66739 RepID=A0A5N5DEF6_9PEZI|nr:Chaperone heat shock protein [Lasiodiplodia theobromae]KAB2576253.1 12 kDa heat shock protein [Lasiodiplodia theobromae]KAF4533943.1 Chaperone heat shock protein [Lasiodiplodia theobromae]KAF9638231.1 hypothetical protein BFW01_g9128 [Lasiodiplodia theobromae]KAK0624474.1 12 kDa heat shock protein [Lasiodiplodia hormozganensis]
MSDAGRKDFTTKAKEELTPDSTKSTQQKTKETFTDTGDKLARGLQTDESKSTGQELGDKVGRSHDQHAHGGTGESILDKAKSAIGMDKK